MSNIRGLDDLKDGGDDDNDKFNDYYAGGEKSGQLIRGAPDQGDGDAEDTDAVSSLFNKAKQFGAQQGSSPDVDESAPFSGSGRTVGGSSSAQQGRQSNSLRHVITFYNNGVFTVDEGPARKIDDPENREFIDSISKGECPRELDPRNPNVTVDVHLVRREEEYVPPKKPIAFTGTGRTLGTASTSSTTGGASSSAGGGAASGSASTGEWAGVDESAPTTSVQLRLADGSRMVARFNHSHTVGDIRRFIRASRPDLTATYALMTAFPSKPLDDDSVTLEAAGLLNAVIIQK